MRKTLSALRPGALHSAVILALLWLAVLWAACAAPGRDIAMQPGDFALLEIQLQG